MAEQKPITLDTSVLPRLPEAKISPEFFQEMCEIEKEVRGGLSDKQVDRMVGRVVAARQALAVVKAQMAAAVRRAENDLNTANYLYAGVIEAYTRERIKQNSGKKSVILPHGTLKTTRVAARPSVEDEASVLDWLWMSPENLASVGQYAKADAPVVRTTVNKSAVLAYSKATGEEIPGVKMLEASEKVCVSVPGLGSVKLDTAAKAEWTDDDGDDSGETEGDQE